MKKSELWNEYILVHSLQTEQMELKWCIELVRVFCREVRII